MTVKTKVKTALIAGLFFLSLGGLVLHYLIHPAAKADYGYVPLWVCLTGVFVTPWLFISRKTLHAGYLINGFTVIIGTITMGHFALTRRPIWPDIAILWAKFSIGYVLFHMEVFKLEAAPALGWKTIRYPHFGYWIVHLFALSTVYTLGFLFWR